MDWFFLKWERGEGRHIQLPEETTFKNSSLIRANIYIKVLNKITVSRNEIGSAKPTMAM